ncbi:hypothetical protein Scep_029498 [Stephania cephalantha]|uniref:LIM zinc-binding domain-containing protein n=1 Tax=Stephania cephalantha TaxID=152367 RepID=A0AAP0E2A0_9MAGN
MASSSGPNYDISQPCIHHDFSGNFMSSYSDRKSRFVRWLIRLFKGTPNAPPPRMLGDENKVWHAPGRSAADERPRPNNEELDHAMPLSLPRDSAVAKDVPSSGLHENFDMFPYPPHGQMQFSSRGYRICGGCKYDIGSGNYLGCMGTFWHPECFCCYHCSQPITEHEFSLSGNRPYHKSCFKELHHPRCEVCHQFIPTNGAGLIEYRYHPFWGQKYYPSHEFDNTARCCSCEQLESWNSSYISLGDGRSLCLECMESAVMDTGDCQSLYHAIRDYYEGMYMKLDQQIPMLLVERQALNEAIEGEKNGYHHMPETRGLCLSEEQTVTSINKKPRVGGNRLIGMKTQQQRLHRKCEVTAILVLYGLPRLLTGSILAHELMHGWLRLKGYRNLSLEVEEGICQVLSYMWLESEVMPGSSSMPSTSSSASSSSSSKRVDNLTLRRSWGVLLASDCP